MMMMMRQQSKFRVAVIIIILLPISTSSMFSGNTVNALRRNAVVLCDNYQKCSPQRRIKERRM